MQKRMAHQVMYSMTRILQSLPEVDSSWILYVTEDSFTQFQIQLQDNEFFTDPRKSSRVGSNDLRQQAVDALQLSTKGRQCWTENLHNSVQTSDHDCSS